MPIWFHIKDYCDNSSIHGLRYLTERDRHWIERFFWLLAMVLSCYGTYLLTMASYLAYQYHAISFATETDYLHWNTSFPAVSVCETADEDKVTEFINEHEPDMEDDFRYAAYQHEIGYYQGSCRMCKQYCKRGDSVCSTNFTSIVKKLRMDCNKLITNCRWNGESFNCCSKFVPIDTEFGPCFTINGRNDAIKNKPVMISNRNTGPGALDLEINTMSRIFLHSSEDVPFINQPFDETFAIDGEGTKIVLLFTVKEIDNDPRVALVDLDRRDCRFPYENSLWMYPYYSYSTCVVQCRAMEMLRLCNCTHHLMPNCVNTTCDFNGLMCLEEYSQDFRRLRTDWYTLKKGLTCDCSASCTEPEYTVIYMKSSDIGSANVYSQVTIKMHALPTERFKRNVIRSKLDLVVSIGGTAGLFLGASLLSAVEFLMYFCVRTCSTGTTVTTPVQSKKETFPGNTVQIVKPSIKKTSASKNYKQEFF